MRTPPLLLLTACAARAPDPARLAADGLLADACARVAAAPDDPGLDGLRRAVIDAHTRRAPDLDLHALPREALVATPPGGDADAYGAGWLVLDSTLRATAPELALPDALVQISSRKGHQREDWALCPPQTCHAGWAARRLGVTEGGASRGLLDVVWEVGKLIALPVAVMVDVATLPGQLLGDDRQPLLTARLLGSFSPPEVEVPPGMIPVWGASGCTLGERCDRRFVLARSVVDDEGPPKVTVGAVLRWRHPGCTVSLAWSIEVPDGPTPGWRAPTLHLGSLPTLTAALGPPEPP